MKNRRPTIPIADWKLAADLKLTREIQNQPGTPTYNCNCTWCQNWRYYSEIIFPEKIQQPIKRIGVAIAKPTELYQYKTNKNGVDVRAIYHAVGKILEGPIHQQHTDLGKSLFYTTVREQPHLALTILPQSHSQEEAPILKTRSNSELIRIDLRVEIPHELLKNQRELFT